MWKQSMIEEEVVLGSKDSYLNLQMKQIWILNQQEEKTDQKVLQPSSFILTLMQLFTKK